MGFSSLTVNRLQSSQPINMNSAMIVLAALMAVAAGEPHHTVLGYSGADAYAPLGYSVAGYHPYNGIGYAGVGALPYAAHHVSPLAYSTAHVSPLGLRRRSRCSFGLQHRARRSRCLRRCSRCL